MPGSALARPSRATAALGVALLAAAGCSSLDPGRAVGATGRVGGAAVGVAVTAGRSLPAGWATGGPGTAIGPDSSLFARGRERRPVAAGGADGVRRVCRAGSWPRGWVAVAYEAAGDGCPGAAGSVGERAGSAAPVAVIVRADLSPVGARLDVCADQPVPARWVWRDDETPDNPDACPGASRRGRPAVRRIVRVN